MRSRNRRKSIQFPNSVWSTDQDCLLIENSHLSVDGLVDLLPFSYDEIVERKRALGLIRREFSMNKF